MSAWPREGEVFHWSGENSERSRIKAGRDLLEYLLALESAGRGYHLIGHSHGGSVIWHALCRAGCSGKSCAICAAGPRWGLRSCSTARGACGTC